MSTERSNASALSRASSRGTLKCSWIDSVIWCPMRMTGFSEVIGSWNTIAICAPQ